MSLARLLAGRSDAPAGFNFEELELFYRGATEDAAPAHLEYVIRLWTALPDRQNRAQAKAAARMRKSKTDLTPGIRDELRGHWLRVGLPVSAFLDKLTNPPDGLSAWRIYRWMSENAPKRVRKDHIEFVLAAWRELPDDAGRPRRIHFIPFEDTEGREPRERALSLAHGGRTNATR